MQFDGQYRINAAPASVWAALREPAIVAACVSGCETLEPRGPRDFAGALNARIGASRARHALSARIVEAVEAQRCRVEIETRGAGFSRLECAVSLMPDGDAAIAALTVNLYAGGEMAHVAPSLLEAQLRQIADDFFARLQALVTAEPGDDDPFAEAAPVAIVPPAPDDPAREGLAPEIWAVGLAGVILILLFLFGLFT